ncbi:MAG: TetR/AcrR family transcriptional regulator [Sphingobacteriales bacterium]
MTEKDKKIQILTAAEELFSEQGFDGTSVRDIAQKAGVNLAMISYYFGSKEKLLTALVEYRSAYTLGILEELNKDQTLSPWDKIDKLVDFYVEKFVCYHRFHHVMTYHYTTTRSTETKELITAIKLRNLDQIRKIIIDGQKKKFFRKVDIEMTMSTLMGTISQITLSRQLYCHLIHIDMHDEAAYNKKIIPRLKIHLKQLLRAHLDINNEE